MHRDLDVHAQIGVEMMSDPSSDARVYLVFTCRRCLVFAFFFRFALPTHTVDPPTTNYPSSTTLSHAPPFALADSTPPIASTAFPTPPKQALHPLHTSLIQPPSVAWIRARRTHPRFARATGHHQERFGGAGSLRSQNDRVNALLLRLVASYRSYLPWLARFASVGDNRWLPDESTRVRIRRKACHNVVILYI